MNIFIVIPAKNEVALIGRVISGVSEHLKNIIVVDDCSTDNTLDIVKKHKVIVVKNINPKGYVKSLEIGLSLAFKKEADYAITFDADGQHTPSDLKQFIKIIEKEQPGIIIGKRNFTNRFMEDIIGKACLMRYGICDPLSGFKAYRKDVYEKYNGLEKKYTIGTEIIFRALRDKISVREINIIFNKRTDSARFGSIINGNLYELRALINLWRI